MSAILSADDLNDFISPGVACIKPVETLPLKKPSGLNPYEVTTEERLAQEQPPPAQITLTDCLACSGCVTSAEAILVSLQSHAEVLTALDSSPALDLEWLASDNITKNAASSGVSADGKASGKPNGKVFVASVSPQVRASLAATYAVSEREAGWMIEQLLCGPKGISTGGRYGNRFTWILDTNAMREVSLVMGAGEVLNEAADAQSTNNAGTVFSIPQKPILSSACPGWICYAEKTHPHVLPHLSRLKSPQALTGTLIKTVLSKRLGIHPSQIWHLAIMPCFDKKLEASRQEFTNANWSPSSSTTEASTPIRDVDCVITAREVLMLAENRGVSFPAMLREPLRSISFPDQLIWRFLNSPHTNQSSTGGTSGGYLQYILKAQLEAYSSSILQTERGRNADVIYYTILHNGNSIFRAARFYGFRNIQNLVRKLKPPKTSRMPGSKPFGARKSLGTIAAEMSLDYVEVMACPGGCTNGGGQIKVEDLGPLQGVDFDVQDSKAWLAKVDEAYFSGDSETDDMTRNIATTCTSIEAGSKAQNEPNLAAGNISAAGHRVKTFLAHWSSTTGLELPDLLYTTYRKVESEVGKKQKGSEVERVADLAGKIGGGW